MNLKPGDRVIRMAGAYKGKTATVVSIRTGFGVEIRFDDPTLHHGSSYISNHSTEYLKEIKLSPFERRVQAYINRELGR